MMRLAYCAMVALAASTAQAQQADPLLDELGALAEDAATPPAGPSELDDLSQGTQTDFPDIETVDARKPVTVTLRALNKVTAKTSDLVIPMNDTQKFGGLEITPRYCDKRPPEEFPETTAFVEVRDKSAHRESDFKGAAAKAAEKVEAERAAEAAMASTSHDSAAATPVAALPEDLIFSGWMFKSSPALNGVEHPVYDIWVIDCKTVSIGK